VFQVTQVKEFEKHVQGAYLKELEKHV